MTPPAAPEWPERGREVSCRHAPPGTCATAAAAVKHSQTMVLAMLYVAGYLYAPRSITRSRGGPAESERTAVGASCGSRPRCYATDTSNSTRYATSVHRAHVVPHVASAGGAAVACSLRGAGERRRACVSLCVASHSRPVTAAPAGTRVRTRVPAAALIGAIPQSRRGAWALGVALLLKARGAAAVKVGAALVVSVCGRVRSAECNNPVTLHTCASEPLIIDAADVCGVCYRRRHRPPRTGGAGTAWASNARRHVWAHSVGLSKL
jgi:hypothetical protein